MACDSFNCALNGYCQFRTGSRTCTWKSILPVPELYRHTAICPDLSSAIPGSYRQTESLRTIFQRANPIYAMLLRTDRAKSGRERTSRAGYTVVPRVNRRGRLNLIVGMFERQMTGPRPLIPTRCRAKSRWERCLALFKKISASQISDSFLGGRNPET